jgi:hypothetical protein
VLGRRADLRVATRGASESCAYCEPGAGWYVADVKIMWLLSRGESQGAIIWNVGLAGR